MNSNQITKVFYMTLGATSKKVYKEINTEVNKTKEI